MTWRCALCGRLFEEGWKWEGLFFCSLRCFEWRTSDWPKKSSLEKVGGVV